MKRSFTMIWMIAVAAVAGTGAAQAELPRVVVSIEPLHALVSGIMDRVAIPELLVRGTVSPHDYRLRSSQKRKLSEADLVIWAGDGLDDFMAEAVADLPETTRVIKITDLDLPVKLPLRTTGMWTKDPVPEDGTVDPHLWLDTDNAAALVDAFSRALIEIDRTHKIDYGRNARTINARLGGLHRQLRRALGPYRGIPFVTQHDALQYLEQKYGLEAIGALMTGPVSLGSTDHIDELIEEAEALDARCVLVQPQFEDLMNGGVAEGDALRAVEIDPLHSDQRGLNAYFEMMRTLPKAVAACIG
ncbi:MAG: zinc ABC transporter solute-binding protein [Alphaproteobacteria bacterium]|nr:zinc ABC transporter solute-binding protein [Alphaproteobacteria bacterium]